MRKLIFRLQGYRLIDIVPAEWELVHINMKGEEYIMVEYAHYEVYYNDKKDKYKIHLKGMRPYAHSLYRELNKIIDALNSKTEGHDFKGNSQDYFNLMTGTTENWQEGAMMGAAAINEGISVLRMELALYQEHMDKIKNDDARLIAQMQHYKTTVVMKKVGLDIWEDLGNVIVTSEGCYFSAYNTLLKFNEDDQGEDEE